MSISVQRMALHEADRIAERLLAELSPGCERIAVAGSIRRRKPDVGDLEIVAVPARVPNLFGDPGESRLAPILDRLQHDGFLQRIKGGAYYQQFLMTEFDCKLDLFTPGVETWGVVFTQRTGSAEFAHQLMTSDQNRTSTGRRGLMPVGHRVYMARLWRGHEMLQTREEEEFFQALQVPWLKPEERR